MNAWVCKECGTRFDGAEAIDVEVSGGRVIRLGCPKCKGEVKNA